MKKFEALHEKIRNRYIFAFSLIALLAIGAFINLYYAISSQYIYAELINKSGKQRMLSQRIALFAHQYLTDKSTKNKIAFEKAIVLMQEDHLYLLSNITSEEIKKMYYEGAQPLRESIRAYLSSASRFMEYPTEVKSQELFAMSQHLLPQLDRVVKAYQVEDEGKIELIKDIEFWILVMTLFTLALEAYFIFKPSLDELEQGSQKERTYLSEIKNAAIADVMRSIAHNWRQPLTVINLITENVIERITSMGLPREIQQDLNKDMDTLRKETHNISSSINTLIRLYDPKDTGEETVIDIHEKLNLVRSFFLNNQLTKINISVSGERQAFIYGNVSDFSQCLIATVQNAVDAIHKQLEYVQTHSGAIELNSWISGDEVHVSVRDNGIGISEEVQLRMFEPFVTTEFQSKLKGISLFLVKGIIEEKFGGKINVRSVPNYTVVTFTFPKFIEQERRLFRNDEKKEKVTDNS